MSDSKQRQVRLDDVSRALIHRGYSAPQREELIGIIDEWLCAENSFAYGRGFNDGFKDRQLKTNGQPMLRDVVVCCPVLRKQFGCGLLQAKRIVDYMRGVIDEQELECVCPSQPTQKGDKNG